MANKDVRNTRTDYVQGELNEQDLPESPVNLLAEWLERARELVDKDFNAMVLSTMDVDGPDSRVVLLRGFDENGLVFYTNQSSKKAKDIAYSNRVALNLFWPTLERQVRIQGRIERLIDEKAEEYFRSRPRASQIGAWASEQSEVIAERVLLEQRYAELEKKFEGDEVPKPPHWGGYRVIMVKVEFWQGRSGRMHDRLRYTHESDSWSRYRLQP